MVVVEVEVVFSEVVVVAIIFVIVGIEVDVAKGKGNVTQLKMKIWLQLVPVSFEHLNSTLTVLNDKVTIPTQQRQIRNRRGRNRLELEFVDLKQQFGTSVPIKNVMAKTIGFLKQTFVSIHQSTCYIPLLISCSKEYLFLN